MVPITNGIPRPMIPPLRQQQARPVAVNRVPSVQIGGHPQRRQRSVNRVLSAPPAIELQPVDPALPVLQLQPVDPAPMIRPRGQARPVVNGAIQIGGHPELRQRLMNRVISEPPAIQLQPEDPLLLAPQLQPVDPAPPAPQLQPVDQTDGNRNPGQSGGQTTRILGSSSNTDPDAPGSVPAGISAATMFKASLGAIFAAAQVLMLHDLEKQGNSAPFALTMVCVTLLLAFLFIATGACMYKRNPVAASIFGNTGFLCITLSFFAMMHVSVPKHLVWLVWTVCGILLLVFAYFFAEDLKDFYAEWRRTVAPARSEV